MNKDFVSGVLSPGRHVRTRLYFTSESHIHSLLTLLRYGGLCDGSDEQWERKPSKLSKLNDIHDILYLRDEIFDINEETFEWG